MRRAGRYRMASPRGRGDDDGGGAQRNIGSGGAVSPPCRRWGGAGPAALQSPREGYSRANGWPADPSFRHKSLLEIMLAVLTQCVAEFGIRGGRGGGGGW